MLVCGADARVLRANVRWAFFFPKSPKHKNKNKKFIVRNGFYTDRRSLTTTTRLRRVIIPNHRPAATHTSRRIASPNYENPH